MLKKIICIFVAASLLLFLLIPSFATNVDDLQIVPNDISTNVYQYGTTLNKLTKLYIKLHIGSVSYNQSQVFVTLTYNNGNNVNMVQSTVSSIRYGSSTSSTNIVLTMPTIYLTNDSNITIYLPIYVSNTMINSINILNDEYEVLGVYYSILDDPNAIANELYRNGYESGYNQGYADGVVHGPDDERLNLVQHVNKAVGFFVGEEYAPYITPFAIAFTLLMAYFIFIRWILLFGKKGKALHIADIVVVAACIGIMAVMYINMFTINIHNTNLTESVYQIANDVSIGG